MVIDISAEQHEWDTPPPQQKETQWKAWTDFLTELEQIFIQRAYIAVLMSCIKWVELCVFADASTMAIAALALEYD